MHSMNCRLVITELRSATQTFNFWSGRPVGFRASCLMFWVRFDRLSLDGHFFQILHDRPVTSLILLYMFQSHPMPRNVCSVLLLFSFLSSFLLSLYPFYLNTYLYFRTVRTAIHISLSTYYLMVLRDVPYLPKSKTIFFPLNLAFK